MKELSFFSGTRTAGVVERLHFRITFSVEITFKPSKRYLTLKAISKFSPSQTTLKDSFALPISWASALIKAISLSSNLIFTTLLCWSAKTAILSNASINLFVLKVKNFENVSGTSWG